MAQIYDLYCERLGPGLLAEPVNAATNAAFLVAAWFAWREAKARGAPDAPTRILVGLVVLIGTGSGLFHTFATGWARVLDEVPILLFQLVYLWTYGRRALGLPRWAAAGIVAAYLAAALYCRGFGHLLNGSLVYAPAVAATLALGAVHWRRQFQSRFALLGASIVLVVAIGFRTLDAALCEAFPLGTHFLWHLLVAAVAYLCLRALVRARMAVPRAD